MRRTWKLTCLILVTACGGGDAGGPSVTPPPPPPTVGPPASVTVQQGDGQSGEPGLELPTRPSVVVRDANNRAVANVAVTFATDSGGGTIAGANATTGADGVAAAGVWTLGADEGRNTLRASVAGLAAVTFAATARIPSVAVGQGTVSAAGGSVSVSRPGGALDGLRLVIPDSAFPGGNSITIRQASSAGFSLFDPAQPASAARLTSASRMVGTFPAITPVITVVSTASPNANVPLLLRIPIPRNTPTPIVAVVDSLGAPVSFLPIVASDSISVTVSTSTLSAQVLGQIGNIPQPIGSGPHTMSIVVYRGTHAASLSAQFPVPYSSGYQFGRHNFAFGDVSTTASLRIGIGMMLAEWSCYAYCSSGVYHTYERAPGIVVSDRPGLITASGLTNDYFRYQYPQLPALVAGWRAQYVPTSNYDWYLAYTLIYFLAYSRAPVPLILTDGVYTHLVLVTAWDPANSRFIVRDASYSAPHQLQFNANGTMVPYRDPLTTVSFTAGYISWPTFYAMWTTAYAQTASLRAGVSGPEPYPGTMHAVQLNSWSPMIRGAGPNDPDTAFVLGDTTRIWQSSQGGTTSYPSVLPLSPGYAAQGGQVYTKGTGGWTNNATLSTSHYLDWSAFPNGTTATYGVGIFEPVANSSVQLWAGWRELRMVKYGISISANVKSPGTPSSFSAVVAGSSPTPPANARYEWDFGDGAARVTTTGPAVVTHTYANNGNFTVSLRVLHPTHSLVIATANKTVNTSGILIWRLTQFAAGPASGFGAIALGLPGRFTAQGGVNNQDHITWWKADSTLLARLTTQPATGLLVYLPAPVTVGGTTYRVGLYLQSDPAGVPGAAAQFDPTQQLVRLAQAPGAPFPDVYPAPLLGEPYADSVVVTNLSNNNSIVGAAINQIRDFTGLAAVQVAPQRKRVLVAWNETMALNGAQASGTLVRTQSLWQFMPNSAAKGMFWDNLFTVTATFSAVRTP